LNNLQILENQIQNRIQEIETTINVIDITLKNTSKYIIQIISEFTFGLSNLQEQLALMQQQKE
jgi:hypothetical protein